MSKGERRAGGGTEAMVEGSPGKEGPCEMLVYDVVL